MRFIAQTQENWWIFDALSLEMKIVLLTTMRTEKDPGPFQARRMHFNFIYWTAAKRLCCPFSDLSRKCAIYLGLLPKNLTIILTYIISNWDPCRGTEINSTWIVKLAHAWFFIITMLSLTYLCRLRKTYCSLGRKRCHYYLIALIWHLNIFTPDSGVFV